MSYFVSDGTEVLIPQLHGERPTRPRLPASRRTSREAFLAACNDQGRQFFAALLARAEATGVAPDWGDVGFTIAVSVNDQRVPILRGYPASAGRGQRLVLLPGEWRKGLPVDAAHLVEQQLAALPGAAGGFTGSKLPLPVDGRFGETHANLIVDATVAVLGAPLIKS